MSYNSKQLKVQSSAKKLPKPKDVDYISKMGYRDDSPFRDNPYNDIYTPNGIIDMSQTGIPLFANGQYLPPYSGMHDMGTENVREIPVAKKGGQKGLKKFTSKNIQTSLNDIMQRNTTLFGSSGKKRYKPDLNYKYGGWLEQYQNKGQTGTEWKSGPVSQSDSVRNMAGNQMRYEHSRGNEFGEGLDNYGNPDLAKVLGRNPTEQEAVDDYMQKIYPQVKDKYPTAMEQVIAGDMLYNSGKEAFNYLPNNWDNRKNPVVSQQNWDKTKITLTEDARRKALNNGRDKYYKNTAPKNSTWDLKTQGSHPAYANTWYGRQHASDQYVPYTEQDFTDKNNPLFYLKKYGGRLDSYQNKGQVNTSNWKQSSLDSLNLYNQGNEMVKWAKKNPNFTAIEHNKKDIELDIKYPVSSMPWNKKNSFIGATNWATLNSTKSGNWGVPLYDKPVGVQKEIKQQLVVSPPVVPPFVIPAPVAVPKVQTEYVIRENNFGPPIKYRINPNTKQYYPITDIPKNTPQSDITTIPFVNEMKKYGGWLDQYQDGSQTKANPLLIQAFQQSLANQKINEQKAIDAKNQEIKNNPLGIKTLTTVRDNTNVVPIRQLTTLSNIEADKKRNEADRLLKQQKKTQGTLRETPKEINPNEAWRLAASNYQGHDKEEMNRIINSSKTVEGLGALAGVTGGGLHALASIPAVANTLGLGFAAHGVYSLPSTYRTVVDPNESVYNKARALTYNTADFLGMKQAAEALKGVGTAGKWAYNSAARSVATSKESGLLSRAHELNPYAFKPNPEAYYRMIGSEGYSDALKSRVIRPPQHHYTIAQGMPKEGAEGVIFRDGTPYNKMNFPKYDAAYYNKGYPLDKRWYPTSFKKVNPKTGKIISIRKASRNGYDGPYMAEVKDESGYFMKTDMNSKNTVHVTKEDFPTYNHNAKFYKEHWLQGYKEVPKQLPGSSNAFKSEIDWAKWNKEIPDNSQLMKEYNAIEQTSKANGTWMKNPDGSAFQGTPEQFVQQNSENFKKAFGNSKLVNPDGSPWILEHGSPKKFDTFDESKFQLGDAGYSGSGIYTVPPKGSADSYTISGMRFHTGDIEPTTYKLYGQGNNPITSEELINLGKNSPAGKEMDLFNFHRKSAPLNEQLLDYDVAIHNQNRGIARVRDLDDAWEVVFPTNKQLKSAIGNNGMFNMTNPNIYKSLLPVGLGTAAALIQEKKYGGTIKKVLKKDVNHNEKSKFVNSQNSNWLNKYQ